MGRAVENCKEKGFTQRTQRRHPESSGQAPKGRGKRRAQRAQRRRDRLEGEEKFPTRKTGGWGTLRTPHVRATRPMTPGSAAVICFAVGTNPTSAEPSVAPLATYP